MLKYETAGDPVSGLKWTRKTTPKIAEELVVRMVNRYLEAWHLNRDGTQYGPYDVKIQGIEMLRLRVNEDA